MTFDNIFFQAAWTGAQAYIGKHRHQINGLDQEDLLQETFIKLWRKRDQLDTSKTEKQCFNWGYRLAMTTTIDLHRKWKKKFLAPLWDVFTVMGGEKAYEGVELYEKISEKLKKTNMFWYELFDAFVGFKGDISLVARNLKTSKRKIENEIRYMCSSYGIEEIIRPD